MNQFILLKGQYFVKTINAIIVLYFKDQNRPLKRTGAKRDIFPVPR